MSKTKNKTRYLILGLLSEQPLSGYEIKKLVDIRFSFFWSESFGQIYPELKKLEAEGSICALDKAEENDSKRDVKKFSITDQGLCELKGWLSAPVEKEMVRYELLLKLYFSNHISSETMLQHITEFQISHKKTQRLFSMFREELEKDIDMHDNHRQVLMVLSFGEKISDAYDAWCGDMVRILSEK